MNDKTVQIGGSNRASARAPWALSFGNERKSGERLKGGNGSSASPSEGVGPITCRAVSRDERLRCSMEEGESGLEAISALANDCLTAGQISTTTYMLGQEEGIELVENTHGIEAILQTSGHTRYSSRIHQHVLAS